MNETETPEPRWRPLTSRQRRVFGVLIEKAKTTPDAYPLSLNALTTGCNQKSNRSPLMSLEPEDVEDTLDELREMGAVAVVEGSGRVSKYRHYAYEWLGVDKQEAAVMAELLLRGEQTVGELRGRAARMDKDIRDVAALRPLLKSLQEKKLVIALTPEGRGQTVTHGLFPPNEMPKSASGGAAGASSDSPPPARAATAPASPSPAERSASPAPAQAAAPSPPPGVTRDMFNELQLEVAHLRAELSRLRQTVEQLEEFVKG